MSDDYMLGELPARVFWCCLCDRYWVENSAGTLFSSRHDGHWAGAGPGAGPAGAGQDDWMRSWCHGMAYPSKSEVERPDLVSLVILGGWEALDAWNQERLRSKRGQQTQAHLPDEGPLPDGPPKA